MKGIVVALRANYFEVEVLLNQELDNSNNKKNKILKLLCTRRSRLDFKDEYANVGDRVFLEEVDFTNATAVISEIETRESLLMRPKVANISDIFIVLALQSPELSFQQANDFLLTAEQSHLNINLVLNKSDLITSDQLKDYIHRFDLWGYRPLPVSAKTGQGMNYLIAKLQQAELSVLCGPSGVGKTSLLNFLLPNKTLRVGSLSSKLKRGRNTTSNVELFSISNDSFVADTPGFNRPEINIEPYLLSMLFPEIRIQLVNKKCKFRNCLHREEPGCVISKSWDRYLFYRQILEDLISSHR